jgi:hypothetical protein
MIVTIILIAISIIIAGVIVFRVKLIIKDACLKNIVTTYDPEYYTRNCRVCGCTWNHACRGGCYWVEDDLCSKCAEKLKTGASNVECTNCHAMGPEAMAVFEASHTGHNIITIHPEHPLNAGQSNEDHDGRLVNGYDYVHQAWVADGKYVRCGHPKSMQCNCYGRLHEGETYNETEHSDKKQGRRRKGYR